jgi:hypothetical protein
VHDLLICCCSNKLVRMNIDKLNDQFSRANYKHGGTIASVCVEFLTSVLRVVVEMYRLVEFSI